MFYGAKAVLLVSGLTFSSHRGVLPAFAQHFVKPDLLPKNLHQWLREAFDERQISDYEFLTNLSDDEVLDLRNKADQFLLHIEAFLEERESVVSMRCCAAAADLHSTSFASSSSHYRSTRFLGP